MHGDSGHGGHREYRTGTNDDRGTQSFVCSYSDRAEGYDGAHFAHTPAGKTDRHAGREHDNC